MNFVATILHGAFGRTDRRQAGLQLILLATGTPSRQGPTDGNPPIGLLLFGGSSTKTNGL